MKKCTLAVFLPLMLIFLSSCFSPDLDNPEKLLQHYIYLAFNGTDEKELEQHLTPEFLQKLKDEQAASNPSPRQISFKNLKLKKYKMINKVCEQENVCQLRFEVSYNETNPQTQKMEFQTETQKLAVIKLNDKKEWKIDEIDHLRTSHEIKTQIDVPLNP